MATSRVAISTVQFDDLRQRLWALPEVAQVSYAEGSGLLFMRQIIRPQLGFQQPVSVSFMRIPLLISRLEEGHRLKRLFNRALGMEPSTFIDLTYATYVAILTGRRDVPTHWFESFREAYGDEAVNRYLEQISTDTEGLKRHFLSLDTKDRKVSELYEFPRLARYPFLLVGKTLRCWDPSLFFRGSENLVHHLLSDAGQEYADAFGRIFEQHVVREALSTSIAFYREKEIANWLPEGAKVPDGVLDLDSTHIFVESKSGLFSEPVMVVGDKTIFAHKTKTLQSAVAQGTQAARNIRESCDGRSPLSRDAKQYLIIVTNVELSIGRGERYELMLPPGTLEDSGYDRNSMPIEHIYFVSIDDFERLMAGVRNEELDLSEFMESIVRDDNDPQTAVLMLGQHLDRRNIPRRLSPDFEAEREELEFRFTQILSRGS